VAIKNALKVKEKNKKINVFVLYRDIRTYGFRESFYQKAREKGVIFIRYREDRKPVLIKEGSSLKVEVFEYVLARKIRINCDLLVLSSATVPGEDNKIIAKLLKVPLNSDGFFLEAHAKLRPVEFATRGIFVAGNAHSPKFIDEAISQALAASQKACQVLSKDKIEAEAVCAEIKSKWCKGCRVCMEVCPYQAISIDEENGVVRVNQVLCQGCGTCSATCPSGAIQQKGFKRSHIISMIDAAL
ncbi:CoB--CoM heterodisulfide reductase iron-sulfur subunit A family protein, partial [Candidatus Aerophobetes bacterium]|nr:CoB--CoM heterodisulfide reductase iron-sulfur subunit A family protein [Candidatus Aerophobetes bacterium]